MAFKRSEKTQRKVEQLIAEGKGKEYDYFVSTTNITVNGVVYLEERYLKYDQLTGKCIRRPKEEGGGSRRIGKYDPVTGELIPTNKGRKKLERERAAQFEEFLATQAPQEADVILSVLPISAARLAALEEFAAPAIAAGQLDLPPASKRKPSKTRIAILEAYAARAVALGEIVLPDPPQTKQPTRQRKTPAPSATSTPESN